MKDISKLSDREMRRELKDCRAVLQRIAAGKDGFLAQTYWDMARELINRLNQ